MILADENIFRALIDALRNNGYEVFSIWESCRGINDISISKLSLEPLRIILTEDKDLATSFSKKELKFPG